MESFFGQVLLHLVVALAPALVYERGELEEAVASYIGRAAEKLRAQDALAGALQVYIRTNPFKPEAPQYQKGLTVPLPEATADTRLLVAWALRILKRIYRPGYQSDFNPGNINLSLGRGAETSVSTMKTLRCFVFVMF